jgi:isopentenyl-diphosphate delta-isomerase
MTGGTRRARDINRRLALAAESAGIALGLGSGRAALENGRLADTYAVRDVAPTIPLFANLGAVQLNYGVTADDARRLVELQGANALYLHFNPLQEALQLHGDTNFRDLLPKIARLCDALEVPVFAKGVGSGIAVKTALRLIEAGVVAIDVAGAGGTSWALVEGRRTGDPARERIAEAFGDWGQATARATAEIRRALPEVPLVASGGIRNGVEVAKAVALGADLCGIALPFLEAANESEDAVHALISELVTALRIAQFASGSRRLVDLRDALML